MWNEKEDLAIAEIVLKYIREGKNTKEAFAEASKKLGRSVKECMERWDNVTRKRFESAIEIAEKSGLMRKHQVQPNVSKQDTKESLTPEIVINYLKENLKNSLKESGEVDELKRENEKLRKELEQLRNEYRIIENDFKSFFNILNRAKEFSNDPPQQQKKAN